MARMLFLIVYGSGPDGMPSQSIGSITPVVVSRTGRSGAPATSNCTGDPVDSVLPVSIGGGVVVPSLLDVPTGGVPVLSLVVSTGVG